ncbi:MAG: sigma-E factor negative regulatory protein RseA [Rhodocyclaceae bacterium]|nr:sigma-E factor negative regulatory protein RseA [Rhodocyclaceae bacterium]
MKDKVSALLDGDLDEQATRVVFDGLRRDPDLRRDWEAYCLIGDVLRGDREGSDDFVSRVMANLDAEPTVLAPRAAPASATRRVWQSLMPIAASVMGVAAVGLVAATLYKQEAPAPQLVAGAPAVKVVSATAPVRPVAQAGSEDALREYVFAHQGLSRGGPLPAGVQYVRTVSDQRQGNGR